MKEMRQFKNAKAVFNISRIQLKKHFIEPLKGTEVVFVLFYLKNTKSIGMVKSNDLNFLGLKEKRVQE